MSTPTPEAWLATLKAWCDTHALATCTECGHLHFDARVGEYIACPIRGCDCPKAPDHDSLQATQDAGDSAV
jgi:hypothetical protein